MQSMRVNLFFRIFATALRYQATLAQLVEQRIRNAWVAGSSPAGGSNVIGLIPQTVSALLHLTLISH